MIDLPDRELRARLDSALGVARFVDDVARAAPFASRAELLATASDAAVLSPDEIGEALERHPRIGEKPAGLGREAAFSRAEQASADADDAALAERIAVGNAAYEARFDRVFLIRAAGRSRAEILAELDRRLLLSDAEELPVVAEQLREIAMLRLEQMFPASDPDAPSPSEQETA